MTLDDKDQIKLSRRAFLCSLMAGGIAAALADLKLALALPDAPTALAKGTLSTRLEEGRPSITAQWTAVLRAAHQLPDDPKIMNDPRALRIIDGEAESELRSNLNKFQVTPSLCAFIVLRSRYAEDELARALERGVRQYVILGAGLDTFPYRNPHLVPNFRIFEVAHPATQIWKRSRLREAGIAIPDSLTFAPIDFERQTLLEGLGLAGFKANQTAFFSLLGVVVYLSQEAVMGTLKCIASLYPGSEIVFDYPIPSSALSDRQRLAREALAKRVAAIGGPWITYFDPDSLAGELRCMGFNYVEDLRPEEANDRYFKGRSDGLHVISSSRLMKARL
ncbi:MAG: class I SAM-dependent methyltransferase [Pseudomonadota bacterium]